MHETGPTLCPSPASHLKVFHELLRVTVHCVFEAFNLWLDEDLAILGHIGNDSLQMLELALEEDNLS